MKIVAACVVLALVGFHRSAAISGGSESSIEKHPYQVAIDWVKFDEDENANVVTMLCSGALLTQKTVITAASCLVQSATETVSTKNVLVRVGSQFREKGGENYGIVGAVTYPRYAPYSMNGNLILLFLDGEVPLRSEVQTVPLVDTTRGVRTGDIVVMSGYGDVSKDDAEKPGQLEIRSVAMPVFDVTECNTVYSRYNAAARGCAGGLEGGLCGKRDVGSPVVNWLGELAGVAFREREGDCGTLGFPTVFTDLSDAEIQAWIRTNVDKL